MCVLEMCADSGSGTREQTAEETSDLAFDYPCVVAIHQHWQLGQGSVLCMCVLERVYTWFCAIKARWDHHHHFTGEWM